ncbi:unnamed protein product, partial [marine sediment metagenome]
MIYIFILLTIFLIGYYIARYYDDSGKKNPFFVGFFRDGGEVTVPCGLLIAICIVLIVAGTVMYISSIGTIAKMEAFHDSVCSVYEYTVDKSEDITINAVKEFELDMTKLLNTGNLAYFELAKSVNVNLTELRDEVKGYNYKLNVYRKYNVFWFTDTFLAEVPDRLK